MGLGCHQINDEAILTKVSRLVEKKHFNPGLNGANWPELVARQKAKILEAETVERLETEIQDLLAELKTSHTGIFHKSLRKIPARFAINATFQRCPLNGSTRWMFQDVHEAGAAHTAGLQQGAFCWNLMAKRSCHRNRCLQARPIGRGRRRNTNW
jgi:hypothetical protein